MGSKNKRQVLKKEIDIGRTSEGKQFDDKVSGAEKSGHEGDKETVLQMGDKLGDICQKLDSRKCELKEVYELLKAYDKEYHRVLYSAISNYVFIAMGNVKPKEGGDEQLPLQFEIENLVQFARKQGDEKMLRIIIKLYDHINLAIRQYTCLRESADEYKKKFESNIEPFKNELVRETNSQLLTLVGMFTALAFLIFGGISSLDNLFSEMNDLPMLKLVALGCVWGMCILNLIFIFLVCIGRMIHLPFKFTDKPDATIREKYSVVWVSDLILLLLLIFSLGVLYIDKYELNKWFVNWTKENPVLFFALFAFILIAIFCVGMIFLFHKKRD